MAQKEKDISLGRVLVIGGCGLLGHHVVDQVLRTGTQPANITVFDIAVTDNRYPGVAYISGDLSDKSAITAAFDSARPNAIINVASPYVTIKNPATFFRCNVVGVQNVLALAQERGVKAYVHTSTLEVIQHGFKDLNFETEEAPVLENPVDGSPYARSKSLGEVLVINANGQNGLMTAAMRIPTLFGEGDSDKSVIKAFMGLGRDGGIKYQVGPNRNLVDWGYAGNIAEGHVLAAKGLLRMAQSGTKIPEEERIDGQVFNLNNDDPWLFWDFVRYVSASAGYSIEKEKVWTINVSVACFFLTIWTWIYWLVTFGGVPYFTTTMLRYTAHQRTLNIDKAKKRLEYKPRVDMKEGLRRSVEWQLAKEKEERRVKAE